MRRHDQTKPGAPSARCAQCLSSFRVACAALTMLAANRYVTWNGTFEPTRGIQAMREQSLRATSLALEKYSGNSCRLPARQPLSA